MAVYIEKTNLTAFLYDLAKNVMSEEGVRPAPVRMAGGSIGTLAAASRTSCDGGGQRGARPSTGCAGVS
jgi:hypothetical protein